MISLYQGLINFQENLHHMALVSDCWHHLLNSKLVFYIKDLVILHQVNLQEHILRITDELRANLNRLLVGLMLGVLFAGVESLLIWVNFSFDLAWGNQFGQFSFDDLERKAESCWNFTHFDHFVWLHILLKRECANLFENTSTAMLSKEVIILKLPFDLVELTLESFIASHHEVVEDITGVWDSFQHWKNRRVWVDAFPELGSGESSQGAEHDIVGKLFLGKHVCKLWHTLYRHNLHVRKLSGHEFQVIFAKGMSIQNL